MPRQSLSMPENPLSADLNEVLQRTEPIWEELRGCRLFVTGGTGFTGCWLLETFAWANEKLGLDAKMLVLTRDYERFRENVPHLACRSDIKFHRGHLNDFAFPAGISPTSFMPALCGQPEQVTKNRRSCNGVWLPEQSKPLTSQFIAELKNSYL